MSQPEVRHEHPEARPRHSADPQSYSDRAAPAYQTAENQTAENQAPENQAVAEADEPYAGVTYSDATAWVAWVLLGGLLLVFIGTVHLGAGLVALLRPQVLAGGRADVLLPVGLTGLAWIELVLGAAALITGIGLIRGLAWARLTSIVLGVLAALVNFAFVGVHPVWSVTIIMLTAVVIYAVAAHGAELARAYGDA